MYRGRIRRKIFERREKKDFPLIKTLIESRPLLRELIVKLLNPEVLSPKEFYDRFFNELMDASEVIIYSPFTNHKRVLEVVNFIKRSKANVTVYTRPEDDFTGKYAEWQKINIEELKKVGVNVIVKGMMHEKAVLIDDKIAYFGSLNVLSRLEEEKRGDYMLRYEGPLVAPLIKEFIESIEFEKNE